MNTEQKLQALIEKAEEFKAFDIKAYDVRGVCSYADFFLFLSEPLLCKSNLWPKP